MTRTGTWLCVPNAASPTFYHYDYADRLVERGRLEHVGTPRPVATFTYDALGNRISKTTYPACRGARDEAIHPWQARACDDGNNIIGTRGHFRQPRLL